MALNFQDLILKLHSFWASKGCLIWQPHNQIVGAGTMNPATYLRVLGPEPWNVAYVEPSVRPDDGRFGENPNRLYTHTQYQVILKPTPENSQELYLESLAAIGIDGSKHDIRFVEDNWAQPAIGAWGLGWEVWLDGLEITQYTYFQQVGGISLDPVPLEITYGLERIAMALQGVSTVFDLKWDNLRTYGDVKLLEEKERSEYAFNFGDVEMLHEQFDAMERECKRTIGAGLVTPAHDYVLQLSGLFNLLDTRGAIGVTERQRFLGRVRDLAREVATAYVKQRESAGFPWLKHSTNANSVKPDTIVSRTMLPDAAPGATATLLLEIGVEELPAHNVSQAQTQLQKILPEALKEARITHGEIAWIATPRRIAAVVQQVATVQNPVDEMVKGPGAKVAFDKDGKPTQAALAFAKRFGVEPGALQIIEDGKTSYVYAPHHEDGKPSVAVLATLLPHVVSKLTFEKTMRWNASNVAFARPLQWFIGMLGNQPIHFEYAGIASGATSTGVRGLGSPRFEVDAADNYASLLRANHILGDVQERRATIKRQIDHVAASISARVDPDEDLLDEVTNLVEMPAALLCDFAPEFLEIPAVILTKTMSGKQRYFTLVANGGGNDGQMVSHFITVRNGSEDDAAEVISGNAGVIHARFSDANYFYKRDKQKPLEELLPRLDTLTFQTKLGSMLDKTRRIESLVGPVADLLVPQDGVDERGLATTAAHLCKTDLVTNMVIEMTSLQGAMGREYYTQQGGNPAVAVAIFEHYLPRFAGDASPSTPAGLIVGLADKLDSLAGLFAVGLGPKGSADPFAQRRAAIGIVQNLVHARRSFSLRAALRAAAVRLPVPASAEAVGTAHTFIIERQRAGLVEAGTRVDVVDAVLSVKGDDPFGASVATAQLAEAVTAPDWPSVLAAYSRCARIAKGFESDGAVLAEDTDEDSIALKHVLDGLPVAQTVVEFVANIHALRPAIEVFFDKVLVNADEIGLRTARLTLAKRVAKQASNVCDVTKLEGF